MKTSCIVTVISLLLPGAAMAQVIQRCEGVDQRISYSNAECPAGTQPVKALTPPPNVSPAARAAAQAKLQRYQEQSPTPLKNQRVSSSPDSADNAIRKAADCGYLQASIDSSRQLSNVLTTRPYYSTEDVDDANARTNELINEYRRVCG